MAKEKAAPASTTDTGRGFAGRAFQRIQGIIDDTGGQAGAPIRVLQQAQGIVCLLYTSPSPRDRQKSRMPSSA